MIEDVLIWKFVAEHQPWRRTLGYSPPRWPTRRRFDPSSSPSATFGRSVVGADWYFGAVACRRWLGPLSSRRLRVLASRDGRLISNSTASGTSRIWSASPSRMREKWR